MEQKFVSKPETAFPPPNYKVPLRFLGYQIWKLERKIKDLTRNHEQDVMELKLRIDQLQDALNNYRVPSDN